MAYTTINKPSDYFNTVLYTGTQTQQTINVSFQPDFVWIKSRSNTQVHALFDAVRGVSIGALQSNATAAENANQKLVAYTSTGFTLPSVNYEWTNTTGWNFASWNWLAGGTASSNSDGSITSTVSANTTSGFSVVSYTGNGTSGATIGHGLGVVPKFILFKNRSQIRGWAVHHASLGYLQFLALNETIEAQNNIGMLNNTAPTSTLITLGNTDRVNESSQNHIAYCFAEVKGFSKFGSYTGNGNADGTFVYTGFKPAWVLIKQSSAALEEWQLLDNKRNTFNPTNTALFPSSNAAENSGNDRSDFLSNGFKCRSSSAGVNSSGSTYIYMAFAENPLVGTNNIPATAR